MNHLFTGLCFHLVVWSVTGYHQQAYSYRQDVEGILPQLFQGIAAIVCNFQSETIKKLLSQSGVQGDNYYCKQMLPVMQYHITITQISAVRGLHLILARCYVKLYDITTVPQ